jgi:hypothetical protein
MSSSKRHFTVVINSKEHGLYISSTPSSAAKKAVSKLCTNNKNKKVEFFIRETTQGSNKKVYGPYLGEMKKLDKPVELKGRVIRYKPIAKLNKKVSKMKGGEVLGIGEEGVVIHPNINNKKNLTKVSKFIEISSSSDEQIDELIRFEEKLNIIDPAGQYHVRMIPGQSYRLSTDFSNVSSINQSNKNEFKRAMNEREKINGRRITPNFKITYDYGGISIEKFVLGLEEKIHNYVDLVNPSFIKGLLLGILNCFKGLYIFYEGGMVHSDLHAGNIVFLKINPQKMRIIDWGNLLDAIPNTFHNNSAPISDISDLDKNMIKSLYEFYSSINGLLNGIKVVENEYFHNGNGNKTKKVKDLMKEFINIPNFRIYKSRIDNLGRILTADEREEVIEKMNEIIRQIPIE